MSFTPISVHASQHPAAVARDLLSSLRDRAVNHKFHYTSYRQARQWSALFSKYSPFINDPACAQMYEQSYGAAARRAATSSIQVVSLGCGSGEKDLRLLQSLRDRDRPARYTPVDVSMPLVLMAHQRAEEAGFASSAGVVCDLLAPLSFDELAPEVPTSERLVTFFGLIPNFEPRAILPNITAMLRPGDRLLLSGNLAPGSDYEAGLRKALPQYDNPATETWLLMFLEDLGIAREDGCLTWTVESDPHYPALRRLSAYFRFKRPQTIQADNEEFSFGQGEQIRLFFSYRYTIEHMRNVLADHGLGVRQTWVSGEEAVALCERQ